MGGWLGFAKTTGREGEEEEGEEREEKERYIDDDSELKLLEEFDTCALSLWCRLGARRGGELDPSA